MKKIFSKTPLLGIKPEQVTYYSSLFIGAFDVVSINALVGFQKSVAKNSYFSVAFGPELAFISGISLSSGLYNYAPAFDLKLGFILNNH